MIIYKTTNLLTGKIYIGQKTSHKGKLINSLDDLLQTDYYGSSKALKDDIKEFGEKNFKREVLEEGIENRKELNAKETEWNLKHDATNPDIGYNISKQSFPFFAGCHHTEEAKEKISKAMSNRTITVETRKKMSENLKGNKLHKNKIASEETRKKLSDAHIGKPSSRKDVKLSEETKEKISKANKGRIAWNKGKKRSSNCFRRNKRKIKASLD